MTLSEGSTVGIGGRCSAARRRPRGEGGDAHILDVCPNSFFSGVPQSRSAPWCATQGPIPSSDCHRPRSRRGEGPTRRLAIVLCVCRRHSFRDLDRTLAAAAGFTKNLSAQEAKMFGKEGQSKGPACPRCTRPCASASIGTGTSTPNLQNTTLTRS